ncbi:MAG: PIN domain-containing protein [Acidimicrobiales bacterium]
MGLLLDTGALIAFERGNREVAAQVEAARRRLNRVTTSSGCVAQAWRTGGPRQALLARLLAGVREVALDEKCSRQVGQLCGDAGSDDVVDAHVALLAGPGDLVLTSDVADLSELTTALGIPARLQRC